MPASTSKPPPKGILKKPKTSSSEPPAAATDDPMAEARRIAVQRATIIHQQRAVQDKILDDLIRLSTYPNNGGDDPADVADFKSMVRAFQPTDYDDMVEERNVNGLCGYALCPRPKKKFAGRTAGAFKVVNAGRPDFGIARVEDLEMWCSQECARRAMYVKVQLSETAAWERVGIPDIEIELMGEGKGEQSKTQLATDVGRLRLEEERKAASKSTALAIERGDGETPQGSNSLIDFSIREKKMITEPVPPSIEAAQDEEDDGHMLLEGYRPR